MERFSRIIQLIGMENWEKINKANITIFGMGAVGSWAAEILARSGVSRFRLIDFDKICTTNINRHICAGESSVGIPKVIAVKNRIMDINPKANIEILETFASRDNLPILLNNTPDIVIDAIDSLGPKIELLEYTYKNSLTVISSMGAALKTDLTAIRTGDLFETEICPLARNLRKYLRRKGINHGIRCVYSLEPPENDALRMPEEDMENDTFKRGRIRNILGSCPSVTAVFGITIADEALKLITEGRKQD